MNMKRNLREITGIVFTLSKVRITVAVALTTLTGYVLGNGAFDAGFIPVTAGIFLLACGSSVINQLQEYHTDRLMERTRHRPLPSGKIKPFYAGILAFAEISAGITILYIFVNMLALITGLTALVWYNLVYTPLKKATPHAVIPGSFVGAIPPLAGWVASGASLLNPGAWFMALFFFVWQVPHFYLLAMKFGPQYEHAGFPVLTRRYSERQLRILILLWVVFTTITALSLYSAGVVNSLISVLLLCILSAWLIGVFLVPAMKGSKEFRPVKYFMQINYYVLLVIVVLNIDHVFVHLWF